MVAVGGGHKTPARTHARPLAFMSPAYALVVHGHATPLQLVGDAPITVARQVVLNVADQLDEPIVGQLERAAARLEVEGAARKVYHFAPPSDGAAFGPLTMEELSLLLTRRSLGAFLSRSSSMVSCPTLRSRDAILAS